MKFTIDYFLNRFKKIDKRRWTEIFLYDPDTGKKDALGHLGVREVDGKLVWTDEAKALRDILHPLHPKMNKNDVVQKINDGTLPPYDNLNNPKDRIIHALKIARIYSN